MISVTSLQAATIDDLHQALLGGRFDVVHFSGHGTNRGLVFEDHEGRIFVPSSEALGRLFEECGVSAVVLNACFSLSVGRLTALGIDFTIASACPIDDLAAIEFSRGFYDAIGSGRPILEAFKAGKTRAELKNLKIDLVLLERGGTYEAVNSTPQDDSAEARNTRSEMPDASSILLGIAIDTSGSMRESIQNNRNREISRLTGVNEAFQSVWRGLQQESEKQAQDGWRSNENVRIFSYLFGTRIGDFVDLLSLLKAADGFDIETEIATLRRTYEKKADAAKAQYGGLAQLARDFGFGSTVDQVMISAEARAKAQIAAELGQRIKSRADALGDVTATVGQLYDLWGDKGNKIDNPDLQQVLFGNTPMMAAMHEVKDRFGRTSPASENEARALLLVSDGMPTDGDPLPVIEQIRSAGVCIVTCFVSASDLVEPYVMYTNEQPNWSEEARLMHRAASSIEHHSSVSKELLARGWRIEPQAKLFVQVNHSEIFRQFVDAVTNAFVRPNADLLPPGR